LTIFDSYGKVLEYLTESKQGDGFVHCALCNRDINVSSMMGKIAAIKRHQRSVMHKHAMAQIGQLTLADGIPPIVPQTVNEKSNKKPSLTTGIRIGPVSSKADSDVNTHRVVGKAPPLPTKRPIVHPAVVVGGDRGKG
jgi:hypothetical protein